MGVKDNWIKGALAEELDALSLDMAGVSDKIGETTDAAADAPTSLFSGIKRILQWFTGTWTAARAAKVDTIDTNVKTVKTDVAEVASNVNAIAINGSPRSYGNTNMYTVLDQTTKATSTKTQIISCPGEGVVFFELVPTSSIDLINLEFEIDGEKRTINGSAFSSSGFGGGFCAQFEFSNNFSVSVVRTGNANTDISFRYKRVAQYKL